jgi:hypothetical protein
MFRIVNFTLVIRTVAVVTTLLSILLYGIITNKFPDLARSVRMFTLAPVIALVLTFTLTSKGPARLIWKVARFFNGSLYPDLNGVWEGEIVTSKGHTLQARATIRQALLHTEIDMHTSTAKSVTLEATPVMEGGQYKLYYTYRAKPQSPRYGAYTGTTIFDIRQIELNGKYVYELSGYFYTERKTLGTTRLRHKSSDPMNDVSFY